MHTGMVEDVKWLQVDLLKVALVKHVTIYDRVETPQRLRNADILVANSEDMTQDKQLCVHFWKITTKDLIQTFECLPLVLGRFVRLSMEYAQPLNICEMQVMGEYWWTYYNFRLHFSF